jgi:hypothetical protein
LYARARHGESEREARRKTMTLSKRDEDIERDEIEDQEAQEDLERFRVRLGRASRDATVT